MRKWTSIGALIVVGVMVAASAIAQADGAPNPTMASLKAVQQALKDRGHDPGAIDGVMGPRTEAAVRDFQKTEGLPETGRLDATTLSKLSVGADTGVSASPPTAGSSPGSTIDRAAKPDPDTYQKK